MKSQIVVIAAVAALSAAPLFAATDASTSTMPAAKPAAAATAAKPAAAATAAKPAAAAAAAKPAAAATAAKPAAGAPKKDKDSKPASK